VRLDSRRRARRGSVLVMYAMLFFAIFGIAAVVIDLGTARLTHYEMQSVADTAAVEGVRNRDATGNPDRQRTADFVAAAFDDNPTNGDRVGYGAGPI
jgi:Flp pilus assembly protein TadG